MPKAIKVLACWLADEHGFSRLSAEEQRRAWRNVLLTHHGLLVLNVAAVSVSPALTLSVRHVVLMQWLLAVLLAILVDIMASTREVLKRPPHRLVSRGWQFAFHASLMPIMFLGILCLVF